MNALETITGLQHIGLPTNNIEKTIEFFQTFGFTIDWRSEKPEDSYVCFLKNGSCMIEAYYTENPAMENGAVDHIALNVTDLDAMYEYAKSKGYESIEGPNFLPFYENGVRYFIILGPNHEKLEFNQKL